MPRATLRLARLQSCPFDPRFFERDPGLRVLRRAGEVFADRSGWPAPEEYGLAFRGAPAPVRFEAQAPARRRDRTLDPDAMYDGRIVRGVVPTRPGNWHDFLNALVWATFPRAKVALHRRQHALMRAWIPPGATALPNARTREQDGLAVLDEGGILLLRSGEREVPLPFGHGYMEGLVFGTAAVLPRGFPLALPSLPEELEAQCAAADEALAAAVEGPLRWVPLRAP